MQGLTEIILLPLVGAITITVFKGLMPRRLPGIWASLLVAISFILAVVSDHRLGMLPASHRLVTGELFNWVTGYGHPVVWNLQLDPISGIWILVITGVGCLIHIYSMGYMADDPRQATFFS